MDEKPLEKRTEKSWIELQGGDAIRGDNYVNPYKAPKNPNEKDSYGKMTGYALPKKE